MNVTLNVCLKTSAEQINPVVRLLLWRCSPQSEEAFWQKVATKFHQSQLLVA
jgi:hypothetical protein